MDLSDPGMELGSPALQADSLPTELSGKPQTLKDDAIKGFTQYVSKSGRLSSVHRTGKDQSLFQYARRVVLKCVKTTGQFHSSPMLVKSCLESCMLSFSITQAKSFQTSKLGLEKAEEQEIKLPTFAGS